MEKHFLWILFAHEPSHRRKVDSNHNGFGNEEAKYSFSEEADIGGLRNFVLRFKDSRRVVEMDDDKPEPTALVGLKGWLTKKNTILRLFNIYR